MWHLQVVQRFCVSTVHCCKGRRRVLKPKIETRMCWQCLTFGLNETIEIGITIITCDYTPSCKVPLPFVSSHSGGDGNVVNSNSVYQIKLGRAAPTYVNLSTSWDIYKLLTGFVVAQYALDFLYVGLVVWIASWAGSHQQLPDSPLIKSCWTSVIYRSDPFSWALGWTYLLLFQISNVSLVTWNFCVMGGTGMVAEVACWMQTGERQAARMRIKYLEAMLHQDIGFFDIDGRTTAIVSSLASDTLLVQDAISEKV